MNNYSLLECEKCGSNTEVFCKGRTQGISCKQCDWSVVTTYIPPHLLDRTIYTVQIKFCDYRNKDQIKTVAKVIGGSFLNARQFLKNYPSIVFTGNALQVMQVRDLLVAVDVQIAIEPTFPY